MKTLHRTLAVAALALAATAASAHSGHGAHDLVEGLAHPLGADHLLAMLAVGLWSAAALPAGRRWQGPAAFMTLLAAGAVAGALGGALPLVESAIALSVAVFGALLVAPRALPARVGLVAIGVAAALHGLAHGAELPAGGSFGAYASGFLLTTAALHGAGLALGRWMLAGHAAAWSLAGSALGVAGLTLWVLA
jgi:urease accessory protein